MVIYTAEQVAEELGIKPRRVRQIAAELGIEKVGRDWVFTESQLRKMRQRNTQVGRPAMRQRAPTRAPKPKEGREG